MTLPKSTFNSVAAPSSFNNADTMMSQINKKSTTANVAKAVICRERWSEEQDIYLLAIVAVRTNEQRDSPKFWEESAQSYNSHFAREDEKHERTGRGLMNHYKDHLKKRGNFEEVLHKIRFNHAVDAAYAAAEVDKAEYIVSKMASFHECDTMDKGRVVQILSQNLGEQGRYHEIPVLDKKSTGRKVKLEPETAATTFKEPLVQSQDISYSFSYTGHPGDNITITYDQTQEQTYGSFDASNQFSGIDINPFCPQQQHGNLEVQLQQWGIFNTHGFQEQPYESLNAPAQQYNPFITYDNSSKKQSYGNIDTHVQTYSTSAVSFHNNKINNNKSNKKNNKKNNNKNKNNMPDNRSLDGYSGYNGVTIAWKSAYGDHPEQATWYPVGTTAVPGSPILEAALRDGYLVVIDPPLIDPALIDLALIDPAILNSDSIVPVSSQSSHAIPQAGTNVSVGQHPNASGEAAKTTFGVKGPKTDRKSTTDVQSFMNMPRAGTHNPPRNSTVASPVKTGNQIKKLAFPTGRMSPPAQSSNKRSVSSDLGEQLEAERTGKMTRSHVGPYASPQASDSSPPVKRLKYMRSDFSFPQSNGTPMQLVKDRQSTPEAVLREFKRPENLKASTKMFPPGQTIYRVNPQNALMKETAPTQSAHIALNTPTVADDLLSVVKTSVGMDERDSLKKQAVKQKENISIGELDADAN